MYDYEGRVIEDAGVFEGNDVVDGVGERWGL